jgi:hypothetical protein
MPEVLDLAYAKQFRTVIKRSRQGVEDPLMSETKRLYFMGKVIRKPTAREKRIYLTGRARPLIEEERKFFKRPATTPEMTDLASRISGFMAVTSIDRGVTASLRQVTQTVRASRSSLLRKLRRELSAETFDEVRHLIRTTGIGELVGPTSHDAGPKDQSFIGRAAELATRGRTDAALDLIYDSVDALMRKGQFSKLDSILSGSSVANLTVDVLLGLLTATLPARNRLVSRKPMFLRIEDTLKERGQLDPGLLAGLE